MRLYSRHTRRRVRYALRCMRRWGREFTREEWAAVVLVVSILLALVLWPAPAGAHDDPCDTCPQCPCLPISEEHWPAHWVYLPLVVRGQGGG